MWCKPAFYYVETELSQSSHHHWCWLCIQPQKNPCLWNKMRASGIEMSVCQVWFMSRLFLKNQSSHRSHHWVPRPKLELHVNWRHPTSALFSTRPWSHSHGCSLDDVSDTHEWPIDAKNVMQRMSHWEHGAKDSVDPTPVTLPNPYTTAASVWPGPDMIQRTSARWGIGP